MQKSELAKCVIKGGCASVCLPNIHISHGYDQIMSFDFDTPDYSFIFQNMITSFLYQFCETPCPASCYVTRERRPKIIIMVVLSAYCGAVYLAPSRLLFLREDGGGTSLVTCLSGHLSTERLYAMGKKVRGLHPKVGIYSCFVFRYITS